MPMPPPRQRQSLNMFADSRLADLEQEQDPTGNIASSREQAARQAALEQLIAEMDELEQMQRMQRSGQMVEPQRPPTPPTFNR